MGRYNRGVNRENFKEIVWQKGKELFRPMPWRTDTRGYYVLVSELMLQQTQVDRVRPKFEDFIARFPDVATLAGASLSDVVSLWNGLGYNRRAKYLHDAAKMISGELGGAFPVSKDALCKLPGVGPNTAGAIRAYSFNLPEVFIETNIRTVYFHHFFDNGEIVDDKTLMTLVGDTLDQENPREFYWALMDYGTWLKKNGAARLAQSKHYKKQSPLKGSVREVRGQIIRLLMEKDMAHVEVELLFGSDERFMRALDGLMNDGLIEATAGKLHLTK